MENIILKIADSDIYKELNSIGFDSAYVNNAVHNYSGRAYKLFNLKPYEANILKQLCLSLGFDCAVHRDTITCKCEQTNAIIFATEKQLKNLCGKLEKQPFRLKQLSEIIKNQLVKILMPLKIRNTVLDWSRPYVMGILNVTPDSFSDGGLYNNCEKALEQAKQLIKDGADIIDIGGESTRPDAVQISAEEEIKRVLPVIKLIRNEGINLPISIDTRNYETAKSAVEAGADIINDVSGLEYDKKLFDYVTANNIPVIIMHSDKVPAVSADYTASDIVEDIYFALYKKINSLITAGMSKENIIADTGIGFGKSQDSCFEILKRHGEFKSLNVPMLLGISRKSFMRNKFNADFNEADIPTAYYSAVVKNVQIHRVHNVRLTKKYLEFAEAITFP